MCGHDMPLDNAWSAWRGHAHTRSHTHKQITLELMHAQWLHERHGPNNLARPQHEHEHNQHHHTCTPHARMRLCALICLVEQAEQFVVNETTISQSCPIGGWYMGWHKEHCLWGWYTFRSVLDFAYNLFWHQLDAQGTGLAEMTLSKCNQSSWKYWERQMSKMSQD